MLSIQPKYAVSQIVRYIKDKSAICLARIYRERLGWAGPSKLTSATKRRRIRRLEQLNL
jgi:hypothetical protein